MKRPLAYITAAWSGDPCEATEQATKYCRAVYEAGFSPICPTLYQPLFLNAALMLLGNGVIEEKGLIERRADRRKARLIHRAAILRRQLRVFVIAAAPCGGDICKGSFHCKIPPFCNVVVQPEPHALSHSWERGRLWRIYPRRLPEKKHSRDRRSRAGR